MRRDWDMFKGESSKLLAGNVKAVVDVGVEDKDTFLGNIIDHERMFYDVAIYINYSSLDGQDVAIRSWEGASSLGIQEGEILKTDEEFEGLVREIKDEVFEGLIESEMDYYTKEELISKYRELDNKRDKLYYQKVVEMA